MVREEEEGEIKQKEDSLINENKESINMNTEMGGKYYNGLSTEHNIRLIKYREIEGACEKPLENGTYVHSFSYVSI